VSFYSQIGKGWWGRGEGYRNQELTQKFEKLNLGEGGKEQRRKGNQPSSGQGGDSESERGTYLWTLDGLINDTGGLWSEPGLVSREGGPEERGGREGGASCEIM